MVLGDFIINFVEHNTLIRLVYKHWGGHKIVTESWDDVSMEWEVLQSKGKYKDYINNEVIGITDILVHGNYSEAVNIVIKEK